MLSPELDLFTIDNVADHWQVSKAIVEKRLQEGRLFCTILLAGSFFKCFRGVRGVRVERSNEPRDNEFLILNYSEVVPINKDTDLDLEKATLKRFRDGYEYCFRNGDADNKRTAIFISREEIERYEATLPPVTLKKKTSYHPIKSRKDALQVILLQMVAEFRSDNNRRPTSGEVLKHLKRLAKGGKHRVVQEVKSNVIYWQRANGKEDKTSFAALQKRLSGINKGQNTFPSND